MTAHNFIDLTGCVFTRLTVISRERNNKAQKARWLCKCDCGTETIILSCDLKSGNTKSCGCLRKDTIGGLHRSHSMSGTNEYKTWCNLRKRCYDENSSDFYLYGARGISVCQNWMDSFLTFFSDMGPRPSSKHSIDRIDNNGNYESSNCRWATPTEQARNRRMNSRNTSGANGVYLFKNHNKWTANIGVNYKHIYLGQFSSFKDACTARKEAELKYW